MPSYGTDKTFEYYRNISQKREAYRKKLIAKGIIGGSNKMMKLLIRNGF